MINWKQKLTSRKLWMAIAAFVTLIMTAVGVSNNVVAQVSAIITAGATVIAYIVGEGLVDVSLASARTAAQQKLNQQSGTSDNVQEKPQ